MVVSSAKDLTSGMTWNDLTMLPMTMIPGITGESHNETMMLQHWAKVTRIMILFYQDMFLKQQCISVHSTSNKEVT